MAALSIAQPRRWYAPVPPMDHDPLGRPSVAENADAEPVEHAGVDTCEREGTLPAADTAPILAKGTVGVVLSGETECAAAAMHDASEPRAHDEAGRRPGALPHLGQCGPEAPPQGRPIGGGECEPKWPQHKSSRLCMWDTLKEAGNCKPGEELGHVVQPTWPHEKSVSLATLSMKNHHAPWPTSLSSRAIVEIANRLRFGAYQEGATLEESKASYTGGSHTHVLVAPGQEKMT